MLVDPDGDGAEGAADEAEREAYDHEERDVALGGATFVGEV